MKKAARTSTLQRKLVLLVLLVFCHLNFLLIKYLKSLDYYF